MADIRAPDIKQKVKEAYESGKYTFKKLQEEFGIPQGTIKSWSKRDKDSGQPWVKNKLNKVATKQKTKSKKVATEKNEISWVKIENEYVIDISKKPCTLKNISEKYDIPYKTVRDYSTKNSWRKKREEYRAKLKQKTLEKTSEKVADKEADRNARVLDVADKLVLKIEEAITQLEIYIVTNRKKTRTVEYNNGSKPVKEVIEEEEIKDIIDGIIDKKGLKALTSALKDIKDIQIDNNNESNNNKELINSHADRVKKAWEDR